MATLPWYVHVVSVKSNGKGEMSVRFIFDAYWLNMVQARVYQKAWLLLYGMI